MRLRLLHTASASLRLAALQVLAKGGGKARLLLVVGGLASHGINSASVFERGNAANSRHHG
ncbi:hypothetical protein GGC47_000906 [Bosea sp. OAE752]|jgi:hypothetical protein|uniref:hypothetical protein n=1 Tax=Bosea TaxID=85413 RepID=UPI00056F0445|nr:hypothetical protein [Bosea spartocytisi]